MAVRLPCIVATVVLATACLDTRVPFRCAVSDQCVQDGVQGSCEPNAYCAFPDPTCKSMRRFGYHAAPEEAGRCTHCGNGEREPGEECDDGNDKSDDTCLPTCRFNTCGDGFVRAGVEECDEGTQGRGESCTRDCLTCKRGDAAFAWEDTGSCYARFAQAVTWDQAEATCERDFGHLAAYTVDAEANTVGMRLLPRDVGAHWIGLRDQMGFRWITSEPFIGSGHVAWSRSMTKPPNSCVTQSALEPWTGVACGGTAPFVCEYERWIVRPTDNHAYKAFYARLPWNEAREFCEARGAHLVAISDAEEQSFVSAQFFGEYWLGGTRAANAMPFTWVTGDAVTYPGFTPGEPNEPRTNAACLVMGAERRWRDRACSGPGHFVCEKE